MKGAGLALFWLVMLAVAALGTLAVWRELDGIAMEPAGWIALGLGVFFSLLVGGGLMMLVFHSSRRGHDARAHGSSAERDPGARENEPGARENEPGAQEGERGPDRR